MFWSAIDWLKFQKQVWYKTQTYASSFFQDTPCDSKLHTDHWYTSTIYLCHPLPNDQNIQHTHSLIFLDVEVLTFIFIILCRLGLATPETFSLQHLYSFCPFLP